MAAINFLLEPYSLYVGTIANIPKGWVLCNGSNGTPNLTGRFLEGVTSDSGTKQTKEAGLPDISGTWWIDYRYALTQTGSIGGLNGAFYGTGNRKDGGANVWDLGGGAPGPAYNKLGFSASRSNLIYGKSTTVQPPSYTVMYVMKIK